MSTHAESLQEWDGRVTSVSALSAHLHALRVTADGRPIPAASVLNLVAVADDETSREVEDMIESMADHQPSRAVIVEMTGGEGGIDAHLETRAQVFKGRTCVMVELIRLTVHSTQPEGAASAIIPLLRSDLPIFLWWPGVPMPHELLFDELAHTTDRLITESGREDDAAAALARLTEIVATGQVAATDLAWARITPWRQLVTQLVGPAEAARMREGAVVQIWHPEGPPTAEALLMAGWLRDSLGERLMVEFHSNHDLSAGGMAGIHLDAGGTKSLSIERIGAKDTAAVVLSTVGAPTRRRVLPLPTRSRVDLLAGELELVRNDRPFERALPHAVAVAGR